MKKMMLLFLLFPVFVFGQGWERTYGGVNGDAGNSVQQTTDGGFIISGIKNSFLAEEGDVYLIKTNEIGDTLWTKAFGGDNYDFGSSVQQTSDGGYITSGWTNSYGFNGIYLIKTSDLGDTIWTKKFNGNTQNSSVQQTSDGGYVVIGTIITEENSCDVYLVKTDSYGDTIWTKKFGGEYYDAGHSVCQTFDGGYIVTGYKEINEGSSSDLYLIKTDINGDSSWIRTFGGISYDRGNSVKQTADGGFIVTGYTRIYGTGDKDLYLLRTNANGDIIWSNSFGGIEDDYGFSVCQTLDDGFIVVGSTKSFGNGGYDVYIIKTDQNGEAIWDRQYGGEKDDFGSSVQLTDDGGYIITGSTESFGNGDVDSPDVYLIKTDSEGNITSTNEILLPNPNRKLIKTLDLQGREIQPRENIPYIEIYDDGSTEKKVIVK
jgi:hypothetical protein